jgi:ElaB/YqjD/DUF883 family membrane-anchored ribosome-binding protein
MANQKTPSDRPTKPSEPIPGVSGGVPESAPHPAGTQGADPSEARAATIESVQQAATEYYQKLAESAGQLTEQARELYDASHTYVRDHPGASLVGAFAVGVLIGWLSARID